MTNDNIYLILIIDVEDNTFYNIENKSIFWYIYSIWWRNVVIVYYVNIIIM